MSFRGPLDSCAPPEGNGIYESFVFVHIPRCAGTSFRDFLYNRAIVSNVAPNQIYVPGCGGCADDKNLHQLSAGELDEVRERKIRVIGSHDYLDSREVESLSLPNAMRFTMLRKPYDRFRSHYYFFNFLNGIGTGKGKRLAELPDSEFEQILSDLSNLQVRYLCRRKSEVLIHSDMEFAKRSLADRFTSFGLLEDLAGSLRWLRRTGPAWLNLEGEFPHCNTQQVAAVEDEPEAIREAIERANSFDQELYDFARGVFYGP